MNDSEIMKTLAICNAMAELDEEHIGSIICMALEEWCLRHDRDILEVAKDLLAVIKQVNEEMGKYKKE